jgi:3-oxoadipate enol-lactonase
MPESVMTNGSQPNGKKNDVQIKQYYSSDTERPRRIVGFHEAERLAGPHMVQNIVTLEAMNPSLGRSILENGFGANTTSSGLGYREWALNTLAVLTAIGDCGDQLAIYLEAALKHGATEDEILSIFNHAASFVGNPRAVNSIRLCSAKLAASREFPDVRTTEKVIKLWDHETLVRDSGGTGVPIVLIHALSMDGRMFQKLVPRLATNGTRVVTYDLRGHGYARGAPLTQSLEHLVADLLSIFDTLNIPQADVVGASYGGAVAQYFTIAHSTRVRSICAMATSAEGHPLLASRASRAEAGEMPALRTEAIVRWFAPETIANNTWCVRYARTQVDRVRIEEWAAAWRAMAKLNCLHQIRDISCPILVLAGKNDLSSTPERMKPIHEEAQRAGRDSEYVELEHGTHMMAMEFPDDVSQILNAFRAKVDKKLGLK